MVGVTNKLSETNDTQAVGQPDSTCESGEIHWREAEREPVSSMVLLCKAISKRKHYSHAGVKEIMETKLERISQLSRENPEMVFTSIGHLINKELLEKCHEGMDGKKATGIDGVTKDGYEENLDSNLADLVERLKRHAYKPQPARKLEIPKENGKTRPLSIYCYEDKLVQEALRRILEAVFEPHFYDEMMGFRPNRGCHDAIRMLNVMIEKRCTSYVLDADIKSFFNQLDHDWILEFIGSRIKDPNILRLTRRMLKAGVMEDYTYNETEKGSGQGSVCSPIIANIYMHYVVVWWYKEKIQPLMRGYSGLELQEEKSRLIEFGRFANQNAAKRGRKAETFDFLGFTHYCSVNRNGKFRVKRKTSRKKFRNKCREVHAYIKENRHTPVDVLIKKVNQILVGYYHYYGITDNASGVGRFYMDVSRTLFYWLNRRSNRRSFTWKGYNEMMKLHPLAQPKIYVSVYN